MASTSSSPKNVHFLALVHGMWGSPAHLRSVEEMIHGKFADTKGDTEIATLRVQTNADSFTYDGLDWGAERAVKEIYAEVEALEKDGLKKVTKFSIVGYSLGGLISRYAIGILYQRGFFRNVKPVNFTTIATPHIGLPRFKGFVGYAMHKLGPIMLSRTGRQFYGEDKDNWSSDAKEGRPLLEVMADKNSLFFKALVSFPNMTIYGNAVHDMTVTYCTALIEPYDPFTVLKSKSPRLAIELDPNYKHVIQSFHQVPEGEEVPIDEFEKARLEAKRAIPWYSLKRYKSGRPVLPPFLQFPFPLNLVLYLLIPLLIPLGLTYAAIKFRRESKLSQKRLLELEKSSDAESSLGSMLRRMEQAVADAIDPADPGVSSEAPSPKRRRSEESVLEEGVKQAGEDGEEMRRRKASRPDTPEVGATSLPSPQLTPNPHSTDPLETTASITSTSPAIPKSAKDDPLQPVLTPSHLKMIASLNSIPQLRKVRAYFPYVRNAHSVIIVRDPGTFEVHKDGLGVLRHWADRFVL
ncbi:DUF676-domain-containing protein [Ceratobasidium sp. AG-I]|nr:DUF676-domain-containing protein [Ceratobasidium sp. AG-I]